MQYITATQYLKESKKIQKELKKWYFDNISCLDTVSKSICGGSFDILTLIHVDEKEYMYRNILTGETEIILTDNNNEIIPLFSETKLRKFIENKINGKFEVLYVSKEFVEGEESYYRIEKSSYIYGAIENSIWKAETSNLFEAYWQVACQIIKQGDIKNV